jgi:hypothetical protein
MLEQGAGRRRSGVYGEYRQHSDGVLSGPLNRKGSTPLTLNILKQKLALTIA